MERNIKKAYMSSENPFLTYGTKSLSASKTDDEKQTQNNEEKKYERKKQGK